MDIVKQLEIFLDFLEVVMGPAPLLSSQVFVSPLHSPLLPVLCRLSMRGRVSSGQAGETTRKRYGQLEKDFMNLCDYRHLQTQLFLNQT